MPSKEVVEYLRKQLWADGGEGFCEPSNIIGGGCSVLSQTLEGCKQRLTTMFAALENISDPDVENDLRTAMSRLKNQLVVLMDLCQVIKTIVAGKRGELA